MLAGLQERFGPALDACLRAQFDRLPDDAPQLAAMARYALGLADKNGHATTGSRGKRLRPTLLLLVAEAAGGDWRAALPAAAAVELLHNFSLVHDDIQDDSPLRRGQPTVWRLWGRPQAINAGDLLFAMAFAALEELERTGIPWDTQLAVQRSLVATCLELTRGQHLDLRFEALDFVCPADYLSMIRGKSAALLAACAGIGAMLAGADPARVEYFDRFGLNLGMAFQIRDDILGIWGDPALTGKSAATDIRSRKKTLPVLHGLERSVELARLYGKQPPVAGDDAQILSLLEGLGARDHALEQESHWARAAREALEAAATGDGGGQLLCLVDELLGRSA